MSENFINTHFKASNIIMFPTFIVAMTLSHGWLFAISIIGFIAYLINTLFAMKLIIDNSMLRELFTAFNDACKELKEDINK